MIKRDFWTQKIEALWLERPIVWLAGVRRSGKTSLASTLPDVQLFDCELASVRAQLAEPEAFLKAHRGRRLVLDEIHRLKDPSSLLKIAADHFGPTKILATGSSTLEASKKFKDTLTGRKFSLHLTPMGQADWSAFKGHDFDRRLIHGGLPPFYLKNSLPERDMQEWMEGYWAKDIQELFRIERKAAFDRFVELLFAQSGGIFEAQSFAKDCEVSRPTISNYLRALEATQVVQVVRPFSTRKSNEILVAPKVYGFDTGFVSYFKGLKRLDMGDYGLYWEHYVLNELLAQNQDWSIRYWRDKQGREVDFVVVRRGKPPIGLECKWSDKNISSKNAAAFLARYPDADYHFVVKEPSQKRGGNLDVLSLDECIARLLV
jgi:uncharacterized protein